MTETPLRQLGAAIVEPDGERQQLELEKLRAEIAELHARASAQTGSSIQSEKDNLEIAKLNAEVAELNSRTKSQVSWLTWLHGWVGFLVTVVTLGASGLGVWQLWQQREDRQRFEINQEIILLTQQLSSEKPADRHNAAILLSSFEEHAIPILVSNLRRTDQPSLPESLADALRIVLEKPEIEPREVLQPLREASQRAVEEQYRKTEPNVEVIANHVEALRTVGAGLNDRETVEALNELKVKINSEESKIKPLEQEGLNKRIERAIKAIEAPP